MKVSLKKLCGVPLILFAFSSPAYADGTESAGGGHDIEDGFKAKCLSIATELTEMPKPAQKLLKFDPFELKATLDADNLFIPKCAVGEDLERLRKTKKKADVLLIKKNAVNLNCTDYSSKDWQVLFESKKDKDIGFFLHESLRIMGVEGDDRRISSSYLAAAQKKAELTRKLARSLTNWRGQTYCLIRPFNQDDTPRTDADPTKGPLHVELRMASDLLFSSQLQYIPPAGTPAGRAADNVIRLLLTKGSPFNEEFEKIVLPLAIKHGCLTDILPPQEPATEAMIEDSRSTKTVGDRPTTTKNPIAPKTAAPQSTGLLVK